MSCVQVIMPPAPAFQSLSLQNMSYQSWPRNNTIVVNSPTPTPISTSSSSLASPSSVTSPRRLSRCHASEIIPRLYISDLTFAENPSLLAAYRITHILSTLPDTIAIPPPHILPFQPARMQIKVEDFPFAELAAHLPLTTKFIQEALWSNPEARVLVHCAEGVSRSVSVVAAFLMAQYGWEPKEAITFIKEKRMVANPNFGFIQQLHEYARDELGRSPTGAMPPSSAGLTPFPHA